MLHPTTIKKIALLLVIALIAHTAYAQKVIEPPADTTDSGFDISNWLLKKRGVLPVPTVITEPALGFGGAASLLYFHSSFLERSGPPDVSGLIGGATENGTWGVGGFHSASWRDDKIRYVGGIFRADVNIKYYRSGSLLQGGVDMNMDGWYLFQQIKFRVPSSDLFIGGRYLYANATNTFSIPIDIPEFSGVELDTKLSEVTIQINYDSRDNVITPTQGLFAEITATYSDKWMGGSDLYGRMSGGFVGFMQLSNRLNLGARVDSRHSIGETPFWARPFIDMRGVPLMKYQDRHVDIMEAELTFNIYNRWHINGFTGLGTAYSSMGDFSSGKPARSGGIGFRYEIARALGLRMGVDSAWSSDDFGIYIVAGHAWLR